MFGPTRYLPFGSRSPVLCLLLALAVPEVGLAQRTESRSDAGAGLDSYGSAYLSLGHWAYDYIDMLIARGRITSLP
ncbi:MAG: hypothetical protein PVI01_15570, partial [Gemmatimonadales bacterium]